MASLWAGADRDVEPDWKPEKREKATRYGWAVIYAHFENACCVHCGLPNVKSLHHIAFRKADSGDDVIENLAPMCRPHHDLFHSRGPGWEKVAASLRVYVLTNRDRCVYMKSKLSWERFNKRYPLLSEGVGANDPGRAGASSPGISPAGDSLAPSESDWEHWEAPDERLSPWDIAYEPTPWLEDR
jgi:hypothetical protein